MITLPTLYARDRKGAIISWTVCAEGDLVVTQHGKLNGKQTTHKDRALPTNTGRANQRLGEAQAEFEAQAAWDKKRKEGYTESIEQARHQLVLKPMLAHPITKSATVKGEKVKIKRTIEFPCSVQRKYNGLRCLAIYANEQPMFQGFAIGTVTLRSRECEVWTNLPHIEAHIKMFADRGDIVDGEIYQKGVPLQVLNSRIKRAQDETRHLQFFLYDLPSSSGAIDLSWEGRHERLRERYIAYVATHRPVALVRDIAQVMAELDTTSALALYMRSLPLQFVPTWTATDEDQVTRMGLQAIADGYEGLILRQSGRNYEFDNRTESLLKWKQFTDEEFVITDAKSREFFPADGSPSHLILDKMVCRNNLTDASFEVVPVGTMAERRDMWENRVQHLGQFMTVRFLERSADGLPQGNPVGYLRLKEDKAAPADGAMWD